MTQRGRTEDELLFRQLLENTQSIFFFAFESSPQTLWAVIREIAEAGG